MSVVAWLLDSDPAIRWQTMRDLTDAPSGELKRERARVTREGLAREILSRQQPDGTWLRQGEPAWASTLFTLLLLRATGADPNDSEVEAAIARAEKQLRWDDAPGCWDLRKQSTGGNTFFEGEEEPCINGGALCMGAYFGRPNTNLAMRLLGEQLDDGGWNCEAPTSKKSSFHTTICVLEGLLEYERAVGGASQIAAARKRGEEYLLHRALYRRLSTGEIASTQFLELAFPPRYHYDILRALDYFRDSTLQPDSRMEDAVKLLESRMGSDGKWPLDRAYDDVLAVTCGEACGAPSQWNTLRALRVLRWYHH